MRYSEWFKRAGDALPSARAVAVGKKLLGYLSIRRETPGVQTLVQRVTLDDGTVVEAAFYGDQPRVIIQTPDAGDACELYVESGMLDLGPNIAADASQRFNRGIPEFDNRPATLYFGDGVECVDGEPGLNGRVSIDTGRNNIASQCLPKQGSGIESRLSDPAKKQAQAMLPASCWSGLMRRYVQAVYGGDALDYRMVGDHLLIEDVDVGGIGKSVGLIEVSGAHYFVFASEVDVSWCRLKFKSKCALAVYRAWARVKAKGPEDVADKLLTVALSAAMPDPDTMVQAATFAPIRFSSPYGWQFNDAAAAVAGTNVDRTHAELHTLTFTPAGAGIGVAKSIAETTPLPPADWGPLVVGPDGAVAELSDTQQFLSTGQAFDIPVACHYSAGRLVVVRYSVESPDLPIALQQGRECGEPIGLDRNPLVTFPTALITSNLNCNVHSTTLQPDEQVPFWLNRATGIYYKIEQPCGMYAISDGETLWSNVAMSDAIGMSFQEDGGSARTTVIRRDWHFVVTSVRMATGSPYLTSFNFTMSDAPNLGDFGYSSEAWTYTLLVPGRLECGTVSGVGVGSGTRHCSSVFSDYCTPLPVWDTSPLAGAAGPCLYDYNIDCQRLCADAIFEKCVFVALVGVACHLVFPRGDATAGIAARIATAGVAPTVDNFYGDGWQQEQVTGICEHPIDGDCTGTAIATCESPPEPITLSLALPARLPGFYRAANRTNPWLPVDNVVSTLDLGMDQRMRVDVSAVLFQGSVGHHAEYLRAGAFSPCEVEWQEPAERTTCPFWFDLVGVKPEGEPIEVETAAGLSSLESMLLASPRYIFQQGYSFEFSASLLLAAVRHVDPFAFGMSIHMDRQAITGGYPTINTPSFVGWA